MDAVIPALYASAPALLPFDTSLAIRAFLLKRPRGNLVVYRADTLERDMSGLPQFLASATASVTSRVSS